MYSQFYRDLYLIFLNIFRNNTVYWVLELDIYVLTDCQRDVVIRL